jgi:hypothetical protein
MRALAPEVSVSMLRPEENLHPVTTVPPHTSRIDSSRESIAKAGALTAALPPATGLPLSLVLLLVCRPAIATYYDLYKVGLRRNRTLTVAYLE